MKLIVMSLIPKASRPSLLHRLERTIFESVEAHLQMDARWCLFLSGGVDSSILLAVARQVSRHPVQAYPARVGCRPSLVYRPD